MLPDSGLQKLFKEGEMMEHGISFGCCLAMVLSYSINHSIGYAIIHGIFSWFYVIYFALTYQ